MLKYGRAGLRALVSGPEARPATAEDRPRRRYVTRRTRKGWVKAARTLSKAGLEAQAAGLRDKAINLERESLRRKIRYRIRKEAQCR